MSRSILVALLLVALAALAACSATTDDAATGGSPEPPSTTTIDLPLSASRDSVTSQATTTTSIPSEPVTSTTTPPPTTAPGLRDVGVEVFAGLAYRGEQRLDVLAPVDGDGWPVVVVLHGGAWVAGSRTDIEPLARAIAAQGAVVFNADYSTIPQGGGYPTSLQDAACAVAFAAGNAAAFGGDPGDLVVVGYSAGAHLGSIVALDPDRFAGDCADPAGSPTAFVGVAGPYDVRRILVMALFFGAGPEAEPERWAAGDPFSYVAQRHTMPVHMIHGLDDRIADPADSEDLAAALAAAGHPVTLEMLPGESHLSVADPRRGGRVVLAAVRASTG